MSWGARFEGRFNLEQRLLVGTGPKNAPKSA
jgi:hypothetical protein